MSKRVISDSTGLYKLNIVNKEKREYEQVKTGTSSVNTDDGGINTKQAVPQSPRKAPLKLAIQNDNDAGEPDEDILKKIAKTQEKILQCESQLQVLKGELMSLQQRLYPSLDNEYEKYKGDISIQGAKLSNLENRDKNLLNSTSSKWKQLKQNGNNLLQRLKDLTLNEEEEKAYDNLVAQNKQYTSDRYRIKDSLSYEYNDTDESNSEE